MATTATFEARLNGLTTTVASTCKAVYDMAADVVVPRAAIGKLMIDNASDEEAKKIGKAIKLSLLRGGGDGSEHTYAMTPGLHTVRRSSAGTRCASTSSIPDGG